MASIFNDSATESIETAKADFTASADHLIEAVKRQAGDVISDLAAHVRNTAHDTTLSLAGDVHLITDAVAAGLRDVKAELILPNSVKEHPWMWLAGGLAAGAVGLAVMRMMDSRSRTRSGRHRSALAGKLAFTVLDVGLGMWVARRKHVATSLVDAQVLH
jgi:hypothetical protein